MPLTDPDLWNVIRNWPLPYRLEADHEVSPKRNCTCFEHNLRKAGGWTDVSANRIAAAYRKFLYLKLLTGETLTPPRWIDQAWHLHLTFPDNLEALEASAGRAIIHRRGLSGREARSAWDRGRALWKAEFDDDPSTEIWPQRPAWWRPWAAALGLSLGATLSFLAEDSSLVQSWVEAEDISPGSALKLGLGVTLFVVMGLLIRPSPDKMPSCG